MVEKNYVVIGEGIAGVTAAETIRAADPAACAALVTDTPPVCACPVFPLDDPEPLAAWLTNRRHGKDDPIVHHH